MRLLPSCILLSGALLLTVACDHPATTEDRREREEKVDQAAHKAGEARVRRGQVDQLLALSRSDSAEDRLTAATAALLSGPAHHTAL